MNIGRNTNGMQVNSGPPEDVRSERVATMLGEVRAQMEEAFMACDRAEPGRCPDLAVAAIYLARAEKALLGCLGDASGVAGLGDPDEPDEDGEPGGADEQQDEVPSDRRHYGVVESKCGCTARPPSGSGRS